MRIIAGTKRGMKLFSPKTIVSRPITDRVKESLFNVLYNYGLPEGKIVADLFCGVGSLGIEALSRGAEFVTFVEKDPGIITVLNRNIEKAGFVRQSKVIRADAFRNVSPVDAENKKFGLVFIDPPYACTENVQSDSPLGRLIDLLTGQITTDGVVIVRTEQRTFLLQRYGRFEVIERRDWGTMAVTILKMVKE